MWRTLWIKPTPSTTTLDSELRPSRAEGWARHRAFYSLLRTPVYYLDLGHEDLLIVFFFKCPCQNSCFQENENYSVFVETLESCSASNIDVSFWNTPKNCLAIKFNILVPQKNSNVMLFPVPSRWPSCVCNIFSFSTK